LLDALSRNAALWPGEIAVSVRDGVVTLSGYVSTYAEQSAALESVLRVSGVSAVADEVRVHVPTTFIPSDSEMAGTLLRTATEVLRIPAGDIHITVQNGWVTLTGRGARREQCTTIEHAARTLLGVTGVSVLIEAAREPAV
jgi:osmotically-inducible protein OsmY